MDHGSRSYAQGIQTERRRWIHLHKWLTEKERWLRREMEEQPDKAKRYCARDQHALILEIQEQCPDVTVGSAGEAERG